MSLEHITRTNPPPQQKQEQDSRGHAKALGQNSRDSTDPQIQVDPKVDHADMAISCLDVMINNLRRNICNLSNSSVFNLDVDDLPDRIEKYMSSDLQYACNHWSVHLCNAQPSPALLAKLSIFCKTKLMEYFEAISVLVHVEVSAEWIKEAEKWYKVRRVWFNLLPMPRNHS